LVLGLRDREALDVVAAAGEEADDAREHAGLVVDDHRQRMALDPLVHGRGRVMGRAARRAHVGHPQWRSSAKPQSPPKPGLSARWLHNMACGSRRAIRPASTAPKPSSPPSAIPFGFAAASSPATNVTDFTP